MVPSLMILNAAIIIGAYETRRIIMEISGLFDYTTAQWFMLVAAAIMVGFSKTGIGGLMLLATSVMASAFGGKQTTGIILPMLIVGDIFAVFFYKQHTDWGTVKRLLPWTFIGFAAGVVTGNYINDKQFKILIALSILVCVALLIYSEKKGDEFHVPEKAWLYIITGIAAGFTSMIGNAAGPIFSVYLLAMGYKKKGFMGTSAVFFLIVNIAKVPLQVFFWHNISLGNLALTGIMIPVITAGALLGVFIIKKINEKPFRYIVIAMTAVAAARLFIV